MVDRINTTFGRTDQELFKAGILDKNNPEELQGLNHVALLNYLEELKAEGSEATARQVESIELIIESLKFETD